MTTIEERMREPLLHFMQQVSTNPQSIECWNPKHLPVPKSEDFMVLIKCSKKKKVKSTLIFTLGFSGIGTSVTEGICMMSTARALFSFEGKNAPPPTYEELNKIGLSPVSLKVLRDVLALTALDFYSKYMKEEDGIELTLYYDDGTPKQKKALTTKDDFESFESVRNRLKNYLNNKEYGN